MNCPVITFALPRSGSTFFTRLINKSTTIDTKKRVRYNGELDALHHFMDLLIKVQDQDEWGVKSEEALEEDKEFLSHYHAQKTSDAISYLANFWRGYCKGTTHNNWGWKNVNYGIYKDDFVTLTENIIELWPGVKFIFLDRDVDDVVKSMQKFGDWGVGPNQFIDRVEKQLENYQLVMNGNIDRSYLLQYEELINYESFNQFINQLNWEITPENYAVIANNKRSNDVGTMTEIIQNMN